MNHETNKVRQEINTIKARNKRVELDKAWELSWTRRFITAVMTYVLIVIFMLVTKLDKPFISAIIPTVAYLISASALPLFKKWWINRQ